MMSGSDSPGEAEGIVIRKSSRDVLVDVEGSVLRCEFRGRMRSRDPDLGIVVGDRVSVTRLQAAEGVIERVLERRSVLVRERAGRERVVVAANVDQLLIVFAARDPPPRWALVDRMLIAAERDGLVPALGLNKADQAPPETAEGVDVRRTLELYSRLGYLTFELSARTGQGLERLTAWLSRHFTVFSGHSGVGKSTLLNALAPGLELDTAEVNAVTGKGRQTTTAVSLHKLPGGGYAADTPGFREFLPSDLKPAELGRHYPEFRGATGGRCCRFSDCLHREEPSCEVRRAVEAGAISRLRYQNYLQILTSLLEAPPRRG